MAARSCRQAFDTLWQSSACGEKPAKVEASYHGPIEIREPVENERRKVSDTPWQPSACGEKPAKVEASYHGATEIREPVENERSPTDRNIGVPFDSVEARPQFPESCQRALPGEVTQKEFDKTEECKKLKEKIEELEAKNSKLLSKVMSIHKNSENMNDPFHLSAVLHMYCMLRLQEWEKFRRVSSLTYKSGSKIIKKLFNACEKDIQRRTTKIFGVLEIPHSNDAMTNSKQEVIQEIRNLLRYSYSQNNSEIYHNIVSKAGIDTKLGTQFTVQCCKVYCSLLLQDPPVEAVWKLKLHEMQYLEHVDKKASDQWEKPAFLWPIMKCREELIVKGVVWDEN